MAEQLSFEEAWDQLVAKAWSDPALKAKLLADPAGVLKDHGVIVPAGITLKVVDCGCGGCGGCWRCRCGRCGD
jgi:hypothetical protein